jgi:hypothetical protein
MRKHTKRKKVKYNNTKKRKNQSKYKKLINMNYNVKKTLNYGMNHKLPHKLRIKGGAIIDDTRFNTAEKAFIYFINHSTPTFYKPNSLSGRIAEFKLNKGKDEKGNPIESPYTSYSRDTFVKLTTGDITSLIVKFVLIDRKHRLITLPNKKQIQVMTQKELKYEYDLQNYIAARTVNNDKDNLYVMPTPYNVFCNYKNISRYSSNHYVELLLRYKINQTFPYFYKLANQDYLLGVIAMTKVEGMIGDELLNIPIAPINKQQLPNDLLDISLSSSLPIKGIISNTVPANLIVERLQKLKKTFLQRQGFVKHEYNKTDIQYVKTLLQEYAPYLAIIYTVLRIVAFTGIIHKDLHQDNYFITKNKCNSFMFTGCVIIDWGDVYQAVKEDRELFLELWKKEQFKELLDKVLAILKTFNKPKRYNNTYGTLFPLYVNLIGKKNTEILLKLYHNECKKCSLYYKDKIHKEWTLDKQLVSILDLETHLEHVEEKLKYSEELLPSMHVNILTQKGYNRIEKKKVNEDVEELMDDLTIKS